MAGDLLTALGLLCNAYMKYNALTMGVADILLKPDFQTKFEHMYSMIVLLVSSNLFFHKIHVMFRLNELLADATKTGQAETEKFVNHDKSKGTEDLHV